MDTANYLHIIRTSTDDREIAAAALAYAREGGCRSENGADYAFALGFICAQLATDRKNVAAAASDLAAVDHAVYHRGGVV